MPRVQVYLPDDLHRELKERGLPASELLQGAIRAELERRIALEEAERYIAELVEEVGEPSAEEQAWADGIVRRTRERGLGNAS